MTVRRQKFNLALDGVIVEKVYSNFFFSLLYTLVFLPRKTKVSDVSILQLAQDFNLYLPHIVRGIKV